MLHIKKEEFEELFKHSMSKQEMLGNVDIVAKQPTLIPSLFELSLTPNKAISGRATWTLENLQLLHHDLFATHVETFITHYPLQFQQTCQRHFTNILCRLTENGEIISKYNTAPLIETTLIWLADTTTPIAVRVNCWSVLYLLRKEQDWIAEELALQITFSMAEATPAMRGRGKKILSLLKRKK